MSTHTQTHTHTHTHTQLPRTLFVQGYTYHDTGLRQKPVCSDVQQCIKTTVPNWTGLLTSRQGGKCTPFHCFIVRVSRFSNVARPAGTSVIEVSSMCRISRFCRQLIDSGRYLSSEFWEKLRNLRFTSLLMSEVTSCRPACGVTTTGYLKKRFLYFIWDFEPG
jgi:hypothetical protein